MKSPCVQTIRQFVHTTKLRKMSKKTSGDITMVSELEILPACEGIQDWLWKTIKTMQGTMELVVQRGSKHDRKDNMRSL